MVRIAITALIVAASATAVRAEPAVAVKGSVVFEGDAPDRPRVRRDSDPYCARTDQLADDIIVSNGKLRDVLVRVKNGTLRAGIAAPPPSPPPAMIDQKDCRYAPHVVGVVVGQKLAVHNSDGTFHNVHGTIGGKPAWNKPSSPGDPDLSLDGGARAGDIIDVVCDVHPWMHAYAVVQDHTAFAVTGDDGGFELRGLPPGSYTLEAWHPVLGTRSLTVKITRRPAVVQFVFKR
jgi:hypothetical protein